MIKMLLAHGVSVNATNDDGEYVHCSNVLGFDTKSEKNTIARGCVQQRHLRSLENATRERCRHRKAGY